MTAQERLDAKVREWERRAALLAQSDPSRLRELIDLAIRLGRREIEELDKSKQTA